MNETNEVNRIRQVYSRYQETGYAQRLWSNNNPGNRAIAAERARVLKNALDSAGFMSLANRRVLDVGCGYGAILASLQQWEAQPTHLFGVELLGERVAEAQTHHPELQIQQGNGANLACQDSIFDLVIFFTVFSSVLDTEVRRSMANEAIRVLKPGGAIVWYDFRVRNPNNPHTRPLTRADIRAMFPEFHTKLQTVTLLPPLARRLGKLTSVLYPLLRNIPFLRTHYLGLLVKPIPQ